MTKQELISKVKNAGVVGAGGAGFPTHVKLDANAEYLIINGAECEPLLRVDRLLMENYAEKLCSAVELIKTAVGAKHAVIATKSHYKKAVEALKKATANSEISLHLMKSYYPSGDEQQMVFEVTGRVVPTGGIPLDIGVVVANVATVLGVADAVNDVPVTEKIVTVTGEVLRPVTLRVPIGTPISELLKAAKAPQDMTGYVMIIGGPCMGFVGTDIKMPVTKTTGGIIVLPETHPLILQKQRSIDSDAKLARAVCCGCSMCTQLCPRNSLGLNVEPHKVMRAFAYGDVQLAAKNGVFSCCDCGICTYFACNFGLSPSKLMSSYKADMGKAGIKPIKQVFGEPDRDIEGKKVPVKRLMARLGVAQYDGDAPLDDEILSVKKVTIPLKMHIGAPAQAVVGVGDKVKKGQLIGRAKDGALSVNIHASIDGTVVAAGDEIVIEQ